MYRTFTLLTLLTCALFAYTQSGQINTSFRGGTLTCSPGSNGSQAHDMALQADGKILVTGPAMLANGAQFATVRLNADGTHDTQFGSNGQVLTSIGIECWSRAVAVQPDGKILVGGYARTGTYSDFVLVRYLASGQLDASFGSGGMVMTDFAGYNDCIFDLALQPDGKIIAGGRAFNGTNEDFAVVRYHANGTVDPSFGGGPVRTQVGAGNDFAWSILLQPDGSVIQSGSSVTGGHAHMALVRYLPNGGLDWGFGTGGKAVRAVGLEDYGYGAALQADGKIVLAGVVYNAAPNYTDLVVLRFLANGQPDPAFANNGQYVADIAQSADQGMDVAVQPDGRLVVAGHSVSGNHDDFLTLRLTSEGAPDMGFGTGGRTLTPVGSYDDLAYSIKLRGNYIYLAGIANTSPTGSPTNFALASLLSDGTPLPVQMIQLTVQRQNRLPQVQWQTEAEIDADHFLVERSADGRQFTALTRVSATGSGSRYAVTDAQPLAATAFYRLKMFDRDGQFSYSRIVALKGDVGNMEVFPNPVRSTTQLQLPSGIKGLARIELVDPMGRVSLLSRVTLTGNSLALPVDLNNRPQGTYYLRASTDGWSATRAVVVER